MSTKRRLEEWVGVVAILGFASACAGTYEMGSGEESGGEGGEPSLGSGGSGTPLGGTDAGPADGGSPDTGTGGSSAGSAPVAGETSIGGSTSIAGGTSAGGSTALGGTAGVGCPSAWDGAPEGPIASSEVIWQRMATLFYGEPVDAEPPAELDRSNVRQEARNRILSVSSLEAPPGLRRFIQRWALAGVEGSEERARYWASAFFMHGGSFARLFAPFGEASEHRVSFLNEPLFLAAYPGIGKRGASMLNQLFCLDVGLPPVAVVPVEPGPTQTTRQAYEASIAEAPACVGCHVPYIDPLGFSLEHFDAMGNFRETENSLPIDASGHWYTAGSVTFSDFPELAAWLSESPDVASCLARKFFQYAREDGVGLAGLPLTNAEADAVACEFVESAYDPLVLVEAVVDTPSFLLE
ncbi:MAG TPA: DUF1588 domain-containing protein [Polyangiaceae bacterium]